MLLEGVTLMLVGMTTVFAFLGILVTVMHAAGWFFQAFEGWFPEPVPVTAGRRSPPSVDDDADIAVVLAAISALRESR